ncbi:MAG: hypothetical protein JW895_10775 [Thermoleophilaceae bacterium]|nr:hypothetical protein [Thermoleophilaceae bacterium]
MFRRVLLSALVVLTLAPAARAADPIMPLSQVRPGMECTGLSVVRGTTISQFDVEILDVIGAQAGLSGPRILVRASGPAVDATGIGPGFSGSPILCPGAGGAPANAGAISEGLGEYGNHVVLVTPIEEMLRDQPGPAPATAAGPARPLDALSVSGLSPRTRDLVLRAAARAKRTVLAAPAGPLGGFAQQPLVPGASVAAMLSSGDIGLGAIGTVTYRDGSKIWAFGHLFDGAGRRALMLEDAYVFGVIGNPLGAPEVGLGTYKLTSAGGHIQGAVTSDTVASIAGNVGAPPPQIPLTITAAEAGGAGRSVQLDAQLADERSLGLGASMSLAAPIGASQALEQLFRDYGPATVTACFRVKVAGRARPIGFCNPYFDQFTPLDDILQAGSLVDAFDLPAPRIEHAVVRIRARRGVRSDVLISAKLPRRVVAGRRARLRITVQRRSGGRRTLSVPMRVPRGLRPGSYPLVLSGTGGSASAEDAFLIEFAAEFSDFFEGPSEPRTLRELAKRVAGLHRDMGITARIRRGRERLIHRSDAISFEGRLRLRLRVARARR